MNNNKSYSGAPHSTCLHGSSMAQRCHVGQVAQKLGWTESPGFFDAGRFDALPPNELRYACRKAAETCGLKGIYLLHDQEGLNHIPIAFWCVVPTDQEARNVHRRVWNLNLVPFVVVESPSQVRVYQGFNYNAKEAEEQLDTAFISASLSDTADVLERLASFHADAIDDGQIFERWGQFVTPKQRVDEHLLNQLEDLDGILRGMGLARDASHCLIGKYVWLWYLRSRRILSDWRLEKFEVAEKDVFSRNATLTAFHRLDDALQEWLNGEIFPLRGNDRRAVKSEHLQKVAGVFAGNDADGQLCLFNEYYDFSHLPIETLSVVYEQFLHHKEDEEERSEGEQSGAYYTPVCLADFMIAEMDRKLPLRDGVAVFDPACGSGAFLVQAYRRLVERTMEEQNRDLRLTELRELLVDNIFGVDRDADACRVARMSLAIALLDYANPPDVSGPASKFKLPTLSENNILQKDFFELDPSWPRAKDDKPPLWIIGNPPWVELKSSKRTEKRDQPAWNWLEHHRKTLPVSGNQVAEMFVWRVLEFTRKDSVIGLVMPAMTLFKHEAKKFRQAFFGNTGVWCVANFANLAYVLFAGRVSVPAACFFYRPQVALGGEFITTYAPFVAEQKANLPIKAGRQLDTWNILVRAQDWREIDRQEAAKGERLTWKMAMWGSERERRLLKRMKRWQSLELWAEDKGIEVSQGPELRSKPGEGHSEEESLIGMRKVHIDKLKGISNLFVIPSRCFGPQIEKGDYYLRDRGGKQGLKVCKGPHLLVDKGRRIACFSANDFIVQPRDIGIHAKRPELLKALALYLTSSWARWHQFISSSEWGIAKSIATLADLKALPIPPKLEEAEAVASLASLYDNLVADTNAALSKRDDLLKRANDLIAELTQLHPSDQDVLRGFFAGAYQCIQGKFPEDATNAAEEGDIKSYCLTLRRELDDYTSMSGYRHQIQAIVARHHVLITITGCDASEPFLPSVNEADTGHAKTINRITRTLRRKHSQWVYFEKAVYIYDKEGLHFIKPRRRLEWNVRQAVLDADDIIAETLTNQEPV